MTIYPVPGRLVRNPATLQPLPEEGLSVEFTPYWRRRESAGDITLADPRVKPAKTAAKGEKE
ncbi:MAG: DUF2635 domain-containing protein [Alphaproteobacteria bacterium]|nr:DUF2635 domain-containing protein [Alphaproteobacteria bacterium]